LVVESPGRLPGLVRISNIRRMHLFRNPRIGKVLTDLEYVRDLGEGIDRMYDEMEKAGLEEPEFIEEDYIFKTALKNRRELREKGIEKGITRLDINKRQKKAIEYIKKHGSITNREYRSLCEVGWDTAHRDLSGLLKMGVLRREGKGRGALYRMIIG